MQNNITQIPGNSTFLFRNIRNHFKSASNIRVELIKLKCHPHNNRFSHYCKFTWLSWWSLKGWIF